MLLNLTDQLLSPGLSILQPKLAPVMVADELCLWACEFPVETGSHWYTEWGFGIRPKSPYWMCHLASWYLTSSILVSLLIGIF